MKRKQTRGEGKNRNRWMDGWFTIAEYDESDGLYKVYAQIGKQYKGEPPKVYAESFAYEAARVMGGIGESMPSGTVYCYLSEPRMVGEVVKGRFNYHPRETLIKGKAPTLFVEGTAKEPEFKGFGHKS